MNVVNPMPFTIPKITISKACNNHRPQMLSLLLGLPHYYMNCMNYLRMVFRIAAKAILNSIEVGVTWCLWSLSSLTWMASLQRSRRCRILFSGDSEGALTRGMGDDVYIKLPNRRNAGDFRENAWFNHESGFSDFDFPCFCLKFYLTTI